MPVRWLRLASLLFLMIPAASSSEVVKLRDQSVVRGRLVSVDGDTLVFKSTFGTLRFHRQQVISIVFDDSAESVALVPAPTTTTPNNAAPAGRGRIEVVFKDRQRLPIVAVGSAWAMQKGKVTIKPRVDEDTLAMNIKPATN